MLAVKLLPHKGSVIFGVSSLVMSVGAGIWNMTEIHKKIIISVAILA